MSTRLALFTAAGLLSCIIVTHAQNVAVAPAAGTLKERWEWAKGQAARASDSAGFWVGYSIERMMGERSWIGSFNRYDDRTKRSLHELITGRRIEHDDPYAEGEDLRTAAGRALDEMDGKREPERKVKKDVAFLFRFDGRSLTAGDLRSVRTSNMTLHVDLEELPLLWLGSADNVSSMGVITSYYSEARAEKVKEKLVGMVGLHGTDPSVFNFLRGVSMSDEAEEVRRSAIFWIGQQDTEEALDHLLSLARGSSSKKILEHAIFAISQISLERSTDELITIGRTWTNIEARKKSIFWLSQKASHKAVATLKDAVYNDANTEVQKRALFALTQVKDGGVDEVIRVARTHTNPQVRKQAIFWLGQSDDPRAFDIIVEIAKGK